MSDTVIHYYYAWLKYYAASIPSDTVLLATIIAYGIAFICLIAYKFASYDTDVLFASKSVISYLTTKENKRMGSLNYYMRSYPKNIYALWEKYYSTKIGKPSDYISTELSYNHGILESGFLTTMKILVTAATAINFAFCLAKTDVPVAEALLMPTISLLTGLSLTHVIELIFTITKRRSFVKFSRAVALLDEYAKEFAPKPAVKAPEVPESLKASIEKVLEKEPLEVYSTKGTSC